MAIPPDRWDIYWRMADAGISKARLTHSIVRRRQEGAAVPAA